jgi:hypothetical protein
MNGLAYGVLIPETLVLVYLLVIFAKKEQI